MCVCLKGNNNNYWAICSREAIISINEMNEYIKLAFLLRVSPKGSLVI